MNERNKVYDIIKPFHRLNPLPLDRSSLFTNFDDAEQYAETDKSAYLGQVVSVVDAVERVVTVYKIIYSGDTSTKTLSRVDDMSFQKILELREYLETVIETKIAEIESGMTEMEERINDVIMSGLTDQGERISALEDRVTVDEGRIQDNKDAIDTLSAHVDTEVERLDGRIDEIIISVEENDPLVTKHATIDGEDIFGKRMSDVFVGVANDLSGHTQGISALNEGLSGLTEEVDELKDRMDALPSNTYSKTEIDNKFSEVYTKEELDAQLEEVNRVVAEALNDLNARVLKNASDISEISAITETVLTKIAEIEETIEHIQPGVDPATREELEQIQQALSALTDDVNYNTDNISGLTEELDAVKDELNDVSDDLDALKQIVDGIANKIGSEDAFSGTTIEEEIENLKELIAQGGGGTLKHILVNSEEIVDGDTATLVIEGDGDIFVEKAGDTVTIGIHGISNNAVILD